MPSANNTTSSLAPTDPPGGSVAPCPDWQLLALGRPAIVRTASGLAGAATRLWLEWFLQSTRRSLGQLLDRPVQIDILAVPPAEPADSSPFGLVFRHSAGAAEGLLALDLAAARAIATAIEADVVGLRGSGALSDAELGLLEYAILVCVEGVLRMAAPAGAAFAIRNFCHEKEIDAWVAAAKLPALSFRLTVAGRQGIVRLWLPPVNLSDACLPALLDMPDPAADRASPLKVCLALPPILLSHEERSHLQPGDILLLGATDLTSFAADCRLVTSTQWVLSRATQVNDLPTVISVRCGVLDIQPDHAMLSAAAGTVMVRPLLGSLSLGIDQIRHWQAGAIVDLAKDTTAPVELLCGLDHLGLGELVKVEGSLGVRLLKLADPPSGGLA